MAKKTTIVKNKASDVQSAIMNMANTTANIICKTLGPGGSNILINTDQLTKITKDGISCLMSMEPENPYDAAVLTVIKDACLKTNKNAGDGTTSTVALLCAIINAVAANNYTSKLNGIQVRNGIMLAANAVADMLKINSKTIGDIATEEGLTALRQIALIATNNDEELADVITEAFKRCGPKANIKIDMSNTASTDYDIVDGFQIDKGYLSEYFADDLDKIVMDNPNIYVSEKAVDSLPELNPVLTYHMQSAKPLIIIAPKFDAAVLNSLVMYKMRGLKICCILLTEFGITMRDILADIAVLTGARLISDQTNVSFRTQDNTINGSAASVTITDSQTTIIGGCGDPTAIANRIENIKAKIDTIKFDPEAVAVLQSRLDNLIGGVAVLSIGGNTAARTRERYDLAEDAVHACKAAIESGVLPGGGSALCQCADARLHSDFMMHIEQAHGSQSSTMCGVRALFTALFATSNWIISNALDITAVYKLQTKLMPDSSNTFTFNTFDINQQQISDAYTLGVLDPTDVVVNALLNAAEGAGILVSTTAIIANQPKTPDIVDAITGLAAQ